MTPRERILATLNRQPADRAPVDVWLTPEILCDLQLHTGVQDELALYHHLGLDKVVWIFPGYRQEKFDPNDSQGTDPWGVPTFKVKSGAAVYQEHGEGPLAEMEEIEELADYPLWPDPADFNLRAARGLAERAREFQFATIGPWVSHFEIYCHLRGMENALMDLVAEPDFVEATLDRIESIQTELLRRVFTEMGDLIDLIFISDDLGTQQSQLMSVPDFERHLKPRIARWCALAHEHGKKVLFHTDGSSRNFVPHLIEAGVDVLNPIQHICPGMDRATLKRDFGDKVLFHGGIENQQILPHGSPDSVRAETRTCLDTLGAHGGYIVCSCHNIQAGTPVENIFAMIDEAKALPSPCSP
jgi:uroporphyrinogen decarboxylase